MGSPGRLGHRPNVCHEAAHVQREPNTTLTFWVYPDSFGLYRELTQFAHAEGFTVAARPLQETDLITASPFGTKSSGQ